MHTTMSGEPGIKMMIEFASGVNSHALFWV